MTIKSKDLTPGTVLVDRRSTTRGEHRTLLTERKINDSGWWCSYPDHPTRQRDGWGDDVLDALLAFGQVIVEGPIPAKSNDPDGVILWGKDIPEGWEYRSQYRFIWVGSTGFPPVSDKLYEARPKPEPKTSVCAHCGEDIYKAPSGKWFHRDTRNTGCVIEYTATPIKEPS